MGTLPRHSGLFVFATIATGAAMLFGLTGSQPHGTFEFSALIVAAILASVLAVQQPAADDRDMMPLSFVIDFTSLLLFGPLTTMLVVVVGTITRLLADSRRSHPLRYTFANAATVALAIQAAGFVHQLLGGTPGQFVWPWQAAPIAAAVLVYRLVQSVSTDVVVPVLSREPVRPSWARTVLRLCPHYVIGASLAVGLVELIDHRMWKILPVAAVPLYFLYRAYVVHLQQREDEHLSLDVIASVDQGISVIDSDGRVTLWNDALERIVGCPRDHAVGRPLVGVLPSLVKTDLPQAIDDALTRQIPRMLAPFRVHSDAQTRILQVQVLPAAGRATLLWQDITERMHAEYELKRSEERLALAAEGATDGLWEWDLRSREFYVSARWRAMMGLPATTRIGRLEDWMERVHADDVGPLTEALEGHLSGKTDHFQFEHRIRHEGGTYRLFLCRGVAMRSPGRRSTRIAGSLTDTTDRAIARDWLRTAGFLDPLTGLSNRSVFVEKLGRQLEEFKQRRGLKFAVLYIDLDRFKVVNDSLGHLVGDALLTAVSRRLESCLRPGDALARLGGDEFTILLNELEDEQQANAIAFRIQKALSGSFSIGGREVFTSASIGIAFGGAQYASPDEIMRDADTAMYHAKSRGKARHELFDADMHARERDRLGLENDLRHAVAGHDFEVHYQPIVSLTSGMCVGFEALVRWTRNGEPIPPATFIPIAEELGLIESLGTWVLQQACHTFAGWQQRFPASKLDCITVNVSSRQLMERNFPMIVEEVVHEAGLKPCDLRLEITETALMDTPHVVADVLRQLRDFGTKIYLDDFGTGYSSLSHLHKLPVDALKIDRSFVKSLLLPDRPAIVESILALARTLNTSVVAEGIESEVQARELERLGCTHAQGFLFSRPLSVQCAEDLLMANRPLGPDRNGRTPLIAATEHERDQIHVSASFEWPEHLASERVASRD
ncbi:MAG TPA: EAL domain-containing protein [Vicinamibacterales bacterium]|nr:EAL domain-containing protein [Vicinamibacterales bacterium]